MSLFPNNWKIDSVDNLCDEITDCINKTAPVMETETPYRMIRTTNVKKGRVNLDGARYVDEATYIKWTRRLKLRRNDIVLTREAPLGDIGLVRTDVDIFLGQRTMAYRANNEELSQRFLYYSLLSQTLQAQIRTYGSGSTVEHMRVPDSKKLQIPYPPLPTQKKIAAILSAYDDLIENNNRRIALLEKSAEELYKEWFVRMRFPGFESAKFKKGIPEGWEVKRIGEVAKINPKSLRKNTAPETINYIDISSVSTKRIEAVNEMKFSDAPSRARRIVKTGDVIWSCVRPNRRSFALILDPIDNTVCSTGFAVLTATDIPFTYLYFCTSELSFAEYLSIRAKGAAYPAVTNDDFEDAQIFIPNADLLNNFHKIILPKLQLTKNLDKLNSNLKTTRDRLLTRLISGKLSVDDLDVMVPMGMEE